MANVNKDNLIFAIRQKTGHKKKVVTDIVDALFEEITIQLKDRNAVKIYGFGTFEVRQRKKRLGVNPRTKEKIKLDSRPLPCFRVGEILKRRVKDGANNE